MNIEHDVESVLVTEEELERVTTRLANEITADYKDSPRKLVILTILKGSMIFAADLIRKIDLPLELEFMKVSSYGATTFSSGNLKITLDLKRDDVSDVDIILIEDIIDSGNTLSCLKVYLEERGAKNVKICALLDKPSRRVNKLVPDYTGVVIPDKFVIGYGLDYDERYRNLPYVGVLKPEVYLNN